MADSKRTKEFSLAVASNQPNLAAGISNLQDKADYGSRQNDKTTVNPNGGASMRLLDQKVNLAASQNTSQKMTDQQATFTSIEEKHTANRFTLDTYDIVVNGHKMNPNLWEYSDFKKYTDMYGGEYAVGGFTVLGTVLTPSWDEQLHRYMLVRRLARMPMFSPKLNVPEILKSLDIEDPSKVVYNYKSKQKTETAQQFEDRIKAEMEAQNKDSEGGESQEKKTEGEEKSAETNGSQKSPSQNSTGETKKEDPGQAQYDQWNKRAHDIEDTMRHTAAVWTKARDKSGDKSTDSLLVWAKKNRNSEWVEFERLHQEQEALIAKMKAYKGES